MIYAIEARNRGLRTDTWQHMGSADTEDDARRWAARLRAAFGKRYEVRRRAVLDTHGGQRDGRS